MIVAQKRQDVVGHGESGTEDQHGCISVDARGGWGNPGIGTAGRKGSGIVPGCENDDLADIAPAVIERGHGVDRPFTDVNASAMHDRESARRMLTGHQRREQARDIISVDTSRYEAIGIGTQRYVCLS
jgi:hypothetical protein